eukprot:2578354-Amphidinium_carterae.1
MKRSSCACVGLCRTRLESRPLDMGCIPTVTCCKQSYRCAAISWQGSTADGARSKSIGFGHCYSERPWRYRSDLGTMSQA